MNLYTYAAALLITFVSLLLIPVALLNVRLDDITLNLLLLSSVATLLMIIMDTGLIRIRVVGEGKQVDVFGLTNEDWMWYHEAQTIQ